MHDFDRRVACPRAAHQHALVTSGQVAECGGTRAMVEHRVAAGRWRKVGPGVYRLAGAPVTWQSQLLAAVLAAGPGAMGSHRSAGLSWELDGCRPGRPRDRGARAAVAARLARASGSTRAPTSAWSRPGSWTGSRSRPSPGRCWTSGP